MALVGLLFASVFVASCSSVETIPRVTVKPNDSGIEIVSIYQDGPGYLIGESWDVDGKLCPPDTPSRTTIAVKRFQSLHNTEPRFFIPSSGRVKVASIERYSDYSTKWSDAQQKLDQWRILVESEVLGDEEKKLLYETQLSEIPWMNAGRCFHGKLRSGRFPWGNAVLFLTSYVQGPTGGPVNNEMMVLVAQGLTDDGRYAVNAHFEIRHSRLPNSLWDERRIGKSVFSIHDECEEAERWLDSQPDDSFSPSIGQYERFLSALEISLETNKQHTESPKDTGERSDASP